MTSEQIAKQLELLQARKAHQEVQMRELHLDLMIQEPDTRHKIVTEPLDQDDQAYLAERGVHVIDLGHSDLDRFELSW